MKPAHKNLWLNSKRLRLDFVHEFDRWSHQVAARPEGPIVLSSCEGDANDDWPPSPPLQEVDPHEFDLNRSAILGVGKSGNSHWSASFESGLDSKSINPTQAASRESALDCGGIRIELACLRGENSQGPPPQLGSRYRLANQIQGIRSDAGVIHLHSVDRSLGEMLENFDLIVSPLSGDDWGTDLQVSVNELIIRPTRISSEPRKPTRWGYWISSCQSSLE